MGYGLFSQFDFRSDSWTSHSLLKETWAEKKSLRPPLLTGRKKRGYVLLNVRTVVNGQIQLVVVSSLS